MSTILNPLPAGLLQTPIFDDLQKQVISRPWAQFWEQTAKDARKTGAPGPPGPAGTPGAAGSSSTGAAITRVIGATFFATGTLFIQIPFAGTILSWAIMADQAGSASVDICFHTGPAPGGIPSIPNTTTDKISASAPVALAAAQSAAGGAAEIASWSAPLSQYGTVLFNCTSFVTAKRVQVELYVSQS